MIYIKFINKAHLYWVFILSWSAIKVIITICFHLMLPQTKGYLIRSLVFTFKLRKFYCTCLVLNLRILKFMILKPIAGEKNLLANSVTAWFLDSYGNLHNFIRQKHLNSPITQVMDCI